MPNSRSAKKSMRQNAKRRLRNRTSRSTLRTAIKKCRIAIAGDDREQAETALRIAVKRLDQAAAKNLIHKNTAARSKSRLAHLLNSSFAADEES